MKYILRTAAFAMLLLCAGALFSLGCGNNSAKAKNVPDLVGMSLEDAGSSLEAKGTVFELKQQPGPDDGIGKIVGQEPAAGIELEADTVMVLVVGIKEQVEMPDVMGLLQDQALEILTQLGLNASPASLDTDQDGLAGVIILQDPAAGSRLDKDSPVSISVGNYVPPAPTYITCPTCGGSGYSGVSISPPEFATCPSCNGTGKATNGYCGACGGSGLRRTGNGGTTTRKTCPTCGGSGKVRQ